MYQQALTGFEKAFGPDHKSTLRAINNLGKLYSNHGRLAEYIKLAYVWRNQSTILFEGLGRMLIKHSNETNAIVAFQQKIEYENGVMIYKNIRCDGCGLSIACAMGRSVCKDCPDVDLCGICLVKHKTGCERSANML